MPSELKQLSPVEVALHVEVPAEEVRRRLDREYAELSRRAHVRGFRPGKAPRHLLRRLYGEELERRIALALATEALAEAIEEHGIEPVSEPEFVEPPVILRDAPLQAESRMQVAPRIESVSFEGLKVERPDPSVSEDEVEARLQSLREAHAVLREPEPMRPAQLGDLLRIDATLLVEGEEREDLAMKEADIDLGSEALLPELKEALLGSLPGEEREATVHFPEGHGRQELRGKEVLFRMKVLDLRERILPELDDEFAKDVSEHDSLEALRAEVRDELERKARERADDELLERLVDKLVEINEVPVPPAMVSREEQRILQSMLQIAAMAGISELPPPEAMKDELRQRAERRARATVLLGAISKQHGIEVTEEDLRAEAERMAERSGQQPAKVLANLKRNENLHASVSSRIVERKIREFLASKAEWEEPGSAGAEAAPDGEGPPEEPTREKKRKPTSKAAASRKEHSADERKPSARRAEPTTD